MTVVGPTEAQLRALVENAAHGVIITDGNGEIQFHNRAAGRLFGCGENELCGLEIGALIPAELGVAAGPLLDVVPANRVLAFVGTTLDVTAYRRDGADFIADVTVSRIEVDGEVVHSLELRDISARISGENERERLLMQLAQSHKLESVGRLAAGIAHEINTPVQYVGDNLQFLGESLQQLQQVLQAYRAAAALDDGDRKTALAAGDKLAEELDLEYLTEEMPRAISQALEGTGHIAEIVSAMKAFCHPGRPDKEPVDLNEAIQNAISVSRNEWKYVALVETDLDDQIPNVVCNENEIKQVLLNLIVNAAHAIGDHVKGDGVRGTIRV